MKNNSWIIAAGVSLIIHAAIFFALPSFKLKNPVQRQKSIELRIAPEKIKKAVIDKNAAATLKLKTPPPPYIDNITQKMLPKYTNNLSLNKPEITPEKMREVILSDTISDKNLKKLPAYMNYYRMIREKIRKNAYNYYDSKKNGEIFLSFIINSNGTLENLSLDNKSAENVFLQRIAVKSVEEASPFPSFPEELKNYTRLHFNISIYFKNN